MADKFPEIDDVTIDSVGGKSDFLAREKEALGDEFVSEADQQLSPKHDVEDEEFEEFKSQFPEVGGSGDAATSEEANSVQKEEQAEETFTEESSTHVVNQFTNLNLNESEHIKEWKKTRDLEISKRDEIASRKLADIKKEAEEAIDDFYENYNNKKDDAIVETKKAEAAFLEKRDKFLEDGTTWDRVVELLSLDKNSDAIDASNHRDKTKFRDLLLALKGKANVPGASA